MSTLIHDKKTVVSEQNQNLINDPHTTFPNREGNVTVDLRPDKTPQISGTSGQSPINRHVFIFGDKCGEQEKCPNPEKVDTVIQASLLKHITVTKESSAYIQFDVLRDIIRRTR